MRGKEIFRDPWYPPLVERWNLGAWTCGMVCQ